MKIEYILLETKICYECYRQSTGLQKEDIT